MKPIISALAVALLAAQDPKPLKPAELKESGGVKITLKWEGDAPKLRKIDVSGHECCKARMVPNESVIINSNNTLRNAYVQVVKGLEGKKFDSPSEEVIVKIAEARFQPHVVGVMTGQPLAVINEDDHCHNAHMPGGNNPEVSVNLTKKGSRHTFKFASEEIGGRMKDDVHDWLECFVHVSSHPYFGITGEDGVVTIEKLPPGKYTLEAVHEKYAKKTAEVTIENGKTADVKFSFSGKD